MKRRDKLILAGVLFLIVGVALSPILRALFSDPEPTPVVLPEVEPEEDKIEYQKRLAALRSDEKVPSKAGKYVADRWGHLGDAGVVATSLDGTGDEVYFGTELIVGVGKGGQKVYARTAAKSRLFEGTVVNRRSGDMGSAASLILPGGADTGEAQARLRAERAPMGQPGGQFGQLGGGGKKKPGKGGGKKKGGQGDGPGEGAPAGQGGQK